MVDQGYVDSLLRDGARVVFMDGESGATVRLVRAGNLSLPTGHVVCHDGLVESHPDDSSMVFSRVPSGEYPVVVSALELDPSDVYPSGLTRGAAVIMTLTDDPVASWRPAVGDRDAPGRFGVDYGFGGIFDLAHQGVLDAWLGDIEQTLVVHEIDEPYFSLGQDPREVIISTAAWETVPTRCGRDRPHARRSLHCWSIWSSCHCGAWWATDTGDPYIGRSAQQSRHVRAFGELAAAPRLSSPEVSSRSPQRPG